MIIGWRRYWLVTGDGRVGEVPKVVGVWRQWDSPTMQAECLPLTDMYGRELPPKPTIEERRLDCVHHLAGEETCPSANPCGIYILPTPGECFGRVAGCAISGLKASQLTPALGFVEGYGVVAEYEYGWRVQYCRIKSLIVDYPATSAQKERSNDIAKLKELWGIGVVHFPIIDTMRDDIWERIRDMKDFDFYFSVIMQRWIGAPYASMFAEDLIQRRSLNE